MFCQEFNPHYADINELSTRFHSKRSRMTKRKNKSQRCIYCGFTKDLTKEHIPPKNLFPKPAPKNLITVPACRKCNESFKLDDEYFRICAALQGYENTAAKKIWDEKVLKSSLRRSSALKRHLINNIVPLELTSPSGIFLGNVEGIKFKRDRINRVLKKIVRGLLWHHYNYVLEIKAEFVIREDKLMLASPHYLKLSGFMKAEEAQKIMMRTPILEIGRGVFKYRHAIINNNPRYSIWWLLFYETLLFIVLVAPHGWKEDMVLNTTQKQV